MYLRACTTERPRVVLLGVDGSDGGGLDALRAIKEDDQLRSMPVVVLGPPGDTHIVDESFELGAAGYMALSPDSSAFTATIQAVYEYWNLSQLPK